jgi:hypothetical protein
MHHESLPFIYQFHSFSILGPHNNRQYFVKYKNLVHVQQATEGDEREESGGRGAVSYRASVTASILMLSLHSLPARRRRSPEGFVGGGELQGGVRRSGSECPGQGHRGG